MDFFAVKIVTGNDVIVATSGQGIEHTSIWHVFRRSLRICSRTRNNEKDIMTSMTSLPVTLSTLTAKKSMKMKFLNDKMYYIFSQKNPKIMNTQNPLALFRTIKSIIHGT